MDFQKGDHIYLIKNNKIDRNIVYEICDCIQEEGGNWHDGYYTIWNATIQNIHTKEEIKQILKCSHWGSYSQVYVEKINKTE